MLGSISMGAQTKSIDMKYNKIQVEDCRVFYREAGSPGETNCSITAWFSKQQPHVP